MSSGAGEKFTYVCQSCMHSVSKWHGRCPSCDEWDTLTKERVQPKSKKNGQGAEPAGYRDNSPIPLSDVVSVSVNRISTGLNEFDRVLGGGLVPGESVILGGNPGAGKSTLLLQSACMVSETKKVVYFTGEESLSQIKDRATRLNLEMKNLLVTPETDVLKISHIIEDMRPDVVIIDSVQTIYHPELDSEPGSVSQLKCCASHLNKLVKLVGCAVVLVGQINKTESLAGPMALMHIVDAIIMLSSTDDARYRILRPEKNRFGPVTEIGVFAMTEAGLRAVDNPSAIFLSRANEIESSGTVVTPLWEGSRPILVEVQSLVDQSTGGNPRRVSVGLDDRRLSMLIAVLSHHGHIGMSALDVFVNVVGGVKVSGTSADLSVISAMISSVEEKCIPPDVIIFGEVGLSGEIRPSQNGIERLKEASKLGFRRAIIPSGNMPRKEIMGLQVFPVKTLQDAMDALTELMT